VSISVVKCSEVLQSSDGPSNKGSHIIRRHTDNRKLLLIQWKPLIMITLGPALFDSNNRLITLGGGYKNLHYLTQFIVTTFYIYFYSVCSALRPPCPFAVEFSLSSL
jgi:hypothetical protein